MKKTYLLLLGISVLSVLTSCNKTKQIKSQKAPTILVKAKKVKKGDIQDYLNLNGKVIFLNKNNILSSLTGYVTRINIKLGDKVKKNQVLFDIQTKENKALGNSRIIHILSPSSGVVNQLNITKKGMYIAEGSKLCSIVSDKDFYIKVNVPFEFNQLITTGRTCKIFLSDHTKLEGTVYKIIPVINEVSQTQDVLIKPKTKRYLPENLNLMVQFIKNTHLNTYLLPKKAVLSNETQSEFWVMKIVKDSIAVKVNIIKGIENESIVEGASTKLLVNDKVIVEGAYGLPNNTVVKIIK